VNVYHPPADGGFVIGNDLSMAQQPDLTVVLEPKPSGDGGCGCGVGAASTVAPAALGLLGALVLMLGVRRRRQGS
jgi:MYXO-CTERM domain-containing protein